MSGLHIKPRWEPALPAEQRSFTAFFQPIFPKLSELHWIYPDVLPFLGPDEEFAELVETRCSGGYIPPNTLLPKFARLVIDDWVDFYGFQKQPEISAALPPLQQRDEEWISRNVDLCFFNVDGAWWEIYARDESLLEAVRRHLATSSDITVKEVDLIYRRRSWNLVFNQQSVRPNFRRICYHVYHAELRDDGVLRVPIGGWNEGYHSYCDDFDVPPDSPDYKFWIWMSEQHKLRWYQFTPPRSFNEDDIKKWREKFALEGDEKKSVKG